MLSGLIAYLDSIKARDPAPRSRWEILLYPGIVAVGMHRLAHWLFRGELFFRDEMLPPGSLINYSSSITVTPKPTVTRHVGVGDADLFQSGPYDKPLVIAQPFFTDEPVQGRMSAGRLWREQWIYKDRSTGDERSFLYFENARLVNQEDAPTQPFVQARVTIQ